MRVIPALCALALAVGPAGLRAQDAPPTQGVLQAAEAGDIACYLRIRDAAGQSRRWMAEFDLCERAPPLIGRAVSLSWKPGRVQHPSCQGDPDCRHSQQVMLVTRIAPLTRP